MSDEGRFAIPDQSWKSLCNRVRKGACVPVIGGQLREGLIPLPEQLACEWANDLGYPLARNSELAMVAEFARLTAADENDLLDQFVEFVNARVGTLREDRLADSHPYRLLAELPLSVYITTAYDDLMSEALRRFRPPCTPLTISCRWKPEGRYWKEPEESELDFTPSTEHPVVFHLNGRWLDPPSMVLTESDHMEYTSKIAADSVQNVQKVALLPPPIRDALAATSWFFIGYGAADRNLRGLLRALASQVRNTKQAVAVQLQHDVASQGREREADAFLTEYFKSLLRRPVDVVLTDARTFLTAIRDEVRRSQ
jgi:hypothetical protein